MFIKIKIKEKDADVREMKKEMKEILENQRQAETDLRDIVSMLTKMIGKT